MIRERIVAITLLEDITIPINTDFLVLDDVQSIRELLIIELTRLGFAGKFLEAENIAEGVGLLEENNIDFILSDWSLPDGNGFEFLKKVRGSKRFKSTPFLMITVNDHINDILRAMNSGASEYLIKPWTENEFDEKLAYAWQKHYPASNKI